MHRQAAIHESLGSSKKRSSAHMAIDLKTYQRIEDIVVQHLLENVGERAV